MIMSADPNEDSTVHVGPAPMTADQLENHVQAMMAAMMETAITYAEAHDIPQRYVPMLAVAAGCVSPDTGVPFFPTRMFGVSACETDLAT
jgi:hypothetical protein